MSKPMPAAAALGAVLVLAGCAVAPTAPGVMVLPGTQKTQAQFEGDAAACQQQAHSVVAPAAQAANDQAVATAAVGTVIGAAVGALLGTPYCAGQSAAWGAGSGLLVGSALGGSAAQASSYGLQQRYDAAYAQCMYALGNQVPAPAGYRRPATVAMPPPAAPRAPGYPPPDTRAPSYPPPGTPPPLGVAAPG